MKITTVLLGAVLAAALAARVAAIEGSLPYPGHLDEPQLTAPALAMLQTGDLNPHMFEYPTLPVYLIAAGFSVGYWQARLGGSLRSVADIGAMDFPYYRSRKVIRAARTLFAVLSVVTIALAGVLAFSVERSPFALLAAPLLLCASPFYFYESWKYLNVDIVGCLFATATVACLALGRTTTDAWRRAVAPGLLAGLTLACKYNLLPIMLPGVVAIGAWSARGSRLRDLALFTIAAALSFFSAVPFALLDAQRFLDEVAGAMHHYAHGHPGFEAAPGLEQARYYLGVVRGELGWLAPWLAVGGFLCLAAADARLAAVLVAFPLGLFVLMSAQRVHFARNAVSLLPFAALFAALGASRAARTVAAGLGRLPGLREHRRFNEVTAVFFVAAAIAATLSWPYLLQAHAIRADSRNVARRWLEGHVPPGTRLLVARELGMDTGALRRRFDVDERWFRGLDPRYVPDTAAYWLVPRFGIEPRHPARPRDAATPAAFAEDRFDVLERFGTALVWVNYAEPVPAGDPAFFVARYRTP